MRIQGWTCWKARLALLAVLPLLGAPSCQQTRQAADVNLDGWVDAHDLERMDACIAQPPQVPYPLCLRADVQGDADVDAYDRDIVWRHQGVRLFTPLTVPYTPASIHIDANGVLYLHAPDQNAINRWSVPDAKPLSPIALAPNSRMVTYSGSAHVLYVAYANAIKRIQAGLPVGESSFAFLPAQPLGLATVGPFVFAGVSTFPKFHLVFDPTGVQISAAQTSFHPVDSKYAWDAAKGRMFFLSSSTTPDLRYVAINPATGAIMGSGDSPYHSDSYMFPPVRVSADGSRVLLGTGDFFDATTLEAVESLPVDWPGAPDSLFLGDGGIVITLWPTPEGNTLLQRWDAAHHRADARIYPGQPVRVLQAPDRVAVVTLVEGVPVVDGYVPGDDSDGDGVAYATDAFPLDPAASQDSDGDGFPDAWNPGATAAQSTTGLALDAFPHDAACTLPAHALPGQPGVCDIAGSIPDYYASHVEVDANGIVYLLSLDNDRLYRWSLVEDDHLNPIVLADEPRHLAYSRENDRLYVGYWTGAVTQIDPLAPQPKEQPFVSVPGANVMLETAGTDVVTGDPFGDTVRSFDVDGGLLDTHDMRPSYGPFVWSAPRNRMYWSQLSLEWTGFDAETGQFSTGGQAPYYNHLRPVSYLRPSPDGEQVMASGGDVYSATSLEVEAWLPHSYDDASWEGELLFTVRWDDERTALEARDGTFQLVDRVLLPGEPRYVRTWNGQAVVVTQIDSKPVVHRYASIGDQDGDGVPYAQDAFPTDPAASQDSDRDGAPDAWNPGHGPEDSSTGLVVDAFPADATCQLPEHGSGGVCDALGVLPASPAEDFCASDALVPAASSGSTDFEQTGEFVPLCDGWILVGEPYEERVTLRNVITGRRGASYAFPSAPDDLLLDEATKRLYVSLPEGRTLAVVDLLSGELGQIPVPGSVSSLSLGPGGGIFVHLLQNVGSSAYLNWLAPGATQVVGNWLVGPQTVRWNPARDELLFASLNSFTSVHRHTFDVASGPSLMQYRQGIASYGQDLVLSPDGAHLVIPSLENVPRRGRPRRHRPRRPGAAAGRMAGRALLHGRHSTPRASASSR